MDSGSFNSIAFIDMIFLILQGPTNCSLFSFFLSAILDLLYSTAPYFLSCTLLALFDYYPHIFIFLLVTFLILIVPSHVLLSSPSQILLPQHTFSYFILSSCPYSTTNRAMCTLLLNENSAVASFSDYVSYLWSIYIFKYYFSLWFVLSVCPFVCELNAVDKFTSICYNLGPKSQDYKKNLILELIQESLIKFLLQSNISISYILYILILIYPKVSTLT